MPFQCVAEAGTGPVSVLGLSTEAMDAYRAAAACRKTRRNIRTGLISEKESRTISKGR